MDTGLYSKIALYVRIGFEGHKAAAFQHNAITLNHIKIDSH